MTTKSISARPLPALTKMLNAAADRGPWSASRLENLIRKEHPSLAQQIAQDIQTDRGAVFQSWGQSCNLDAGTGLSTVHPKVLAALCEWAGQSWDPEAQITNAGLLHTYGYLLSNQKTSFGYKRARWCQDAMQKGLGLPGAFLSPKPKTGTLLSNVTTLCEAVFADFLDIEEPTLLAPELSGFTLLETVEDGSTTLVTRVIEFPRGSKESSAALFYAVKSENTFEFITVFPVSSWMTGKIRKNAGKGPAKIKTRYNAVVPALGGDTHRGSVTLEAWGAAS